MTIKRIRFDDEFKRELCQSQDYRCMYCGRRRGFRDLEIDHKIPIAQGGNNRPSNLQMLCHSCNKRKGDQTDTEFRRRYRSLLPSRKNEIPYPSIQQEEFDAVTASTIRAKRPTSDPQRETAPILNSGQHSNGESQRVVQIEKLYRGYVGLLSDELHCKWTPVGEVAEAQWQYSTSQQGQWSEWYELKIELRDAGFGVVHGVPKEGVYSVRVRVRDASGWHPWSERLEET